MTAKARSSWPWLRVRSWVVATALLVAAGLVVGCSSGSSIESNTPRIRSTAEELEAGLLTRADLEGVPGLPPLLKERGSEASVYENPDPRGPCGAEIQQFDLSKGAIESFVGNRGALISSVTSIGDAAAIAYMDANLADARPGCPPFRSTTNQGTTQTVSTEFADAPLVGDQRLTQLVKFTNQGQTAYGAPVLVRRGGTIGLALALSSNPIDPETAIALTRAVDTALARLPAT